MRTLLFSIFSPYLVILQSNLRDLSLYPACVEDSECGQGRACFQYMCLPWASTSGFRWCSGHSDCTSLDKRQGGDGNDGMCYTHKNKTIRFGICLRKIETKKCWTHSDCPRYLRCTNGYCGDPLYFKALQQRPCTEDQECEKLLTGEMCCYDTASADRWSEGQEGVHRKCCNNPKGSPVVRPPKNISQEQLEKLNNGISHLAPHFLDFVVCEGLSYQMMLKLSSCQRYTTTTTKSKTMDKDTSAGLQVLSDLGLMVVLKTVASRLS